ncbi:DegT/DnrJ/EryC1/StrS aminotransferase family protein [Candidatus Pseudothioglobus singularis]|nr:DegT/DnrJ/EryC1/StrS aminotransferase family protein [Candidatus Pseudothioglobus singularis]
MNTWPNFSQDEINAVSSVLKSGNVNYWTGAECGKFESEFADFCNSKYAIALMNGTVALDLALKAIKISPGDEVIVTSRTFFSSVSSIVNLGATPIFADVLMDSQNIDPDSIYKKITNKTKAIICVHLAGWPCDMDSIMDLAVQHELFVIEDCAQAHGAKYKGKPVGSIGHIGSWSFCQDKIMTTGGEGGMVTTNDEVFWQSMWAYKDHGKSYEATFNSEQTSGYRWLHESFGSNYRMTEMQAAIGRIQLKKMTSWHTMRLVNANKIWTVAKKYKGLYVSEVPNYIEHAAYKCYVFVKPSQLKEGWNRDRIIEEINLLGVPCFFGSCSELYLEKAFDDTNFRPTERLPVAKELGETSIVFLVHPTLTIDEIEQTCDAITIVMKLASK